MLHREKERHTKSLYSDRKKSHSSRDGENSGPRPFNHSPWWCVGKERVQTCNHWTNMWKGWFIWNYRGREKQKSPFLPLEWERDVKKWTNVAVLLCLSLAPRPSAVSSNCSLRGCNKFRTNIMSENIANKTQTPPPTTWKFSRNPKLLKHKWSFCLLKYEIWRRFGMIVVLAC